MSNASATTIAAPPPHRMSLANGRAGKLPKPVRAVIYGPEKIGKSSFAASAPSPAFLGAEDGTSELDVFRLPTPETLDDVFAGLTELGTAKHPFKTLVIDTLDWLEPLIHAHICHRDKKDNIEDYGYGKGYVIALVEWRKLTMWFDALRDKRGMHIIALAHAKKALFSNPEGDDFDQYALKCHPGASALIREWVDVVAFANYETLTLPKGAKERKAKLVPSFDSPRYLYLQRRPAFEAGTRFHGMPERVALSWDDFWSEIVKSRANKVVSTEELASLTERIRETVAKLGDPDAEKKILEWLAKPQSSEDLNKMLNRIAAKAAEKEIAQ